MTHEIPESFRLKVFAEVFSFSGPYEEPVESSSELIDFKEITVLEDPEKALFTIGKQRFRQAYDLIAQIAGEATLTPDEAVTIYHTKAFMKKCSPEQRKQILLLKAHGKCFHNIMWQLIKVRIPEQKFVSVLEVRPGWRVVGGMRPQDLLRSLPKGIHFTFVQV